MQKLKGGLRVTLTSRTKAPPVVTAWQIAGNWSGLDGCEVHCPHLPTVRAPGGARYARTRRGAHSSAGLRALDGVRPLLSGWAETERCTSTRSSLPRCRDAAMALGCDAAMAVGCDATVAWRRSILNNATHGLFLIEQTPFRTLCTHRLPSHSHRSLYPPITLF